MQKILVILGATATGKSDIAVQLAKKYNGEIISADSRQVYTGLNIGTGKITKKEMLGIPHHLLDICSPKKVFSVSEWKRLAEKSITDIASRGKLPIICGGTGFYIQSIVNGVVLPEVPPNTKLREKIEKKSLEALIAMLQKIDPKRAETIDLKNKTRLVRAIEIATALGSVPPLPSPQFEANKNSPYDMLQIGLTVPDEDLKMRIHTRLFARVTKGMIAEAQEMHDHGLSWKRMYNLGLEYRYLAELLQNKITKAEFLEKLETEIWHYARRQKQWFKRDATIQWFTPTNYSKIEKEVEKFIKL